MPTDHPDNRPIRAGVVNLTTKQTSIKAERATMTAGVVKVIKQELPRCDKAKDPLTRDERAELTALIKEFAATRNLANHPTTMGGAWSFFYKQVLRGEVNGIDQIERCDFQTCKKLLNDRIRLEEARNPTSARRKTGYGSSRIGAIQARCKELGITDDIRKQYQRDRWGHDSLTAFSDSELEQFVQYVRQDRPLFQHREKVNGTEQGLRVKALIAWLDEKEAEAIARGEAFNRQRLPFTKDEIHAELRARDRSLFTISSATFEGFWQDKPKGLCGVKTGRRPSSTT